LQLPAEPASVPLARRHVAAVVEQLDIGDLGDTAVLVVSELVTNAVRHAGTELQVTVVAEPGVLRIEVEDGSSTLPESREAGLFDAGGRGLPLVAALADRWGTEATTTGKLVWAELDAPG
jgi:anti-sigma regulatory factor (Ser/Thr protein kinase)